MPNRFWLIHLLSVLEENREQSPEELKERMRIHPDDNNNPQIGQLLERLKGMVPPLVEHPSRGRWKRTPQGTAVVRQVEQLLANLFP